MKDSFAKIINGKPLSLDKIAFLTIVSGLLDSGVSFGKIYLFHFFSTWLFIKLLLKKNELKKVILISLEKKVFLFPFIYTSFSLASIIWANSTSEAIKKTIMISFGIPIFLSFIILSQKKDSFNKLLKGCFIVLLLHISLALLETLSSFRWPISSLSALAYIVQRSPIEDPSFFSLLRPTTFYWNINDSALISLLTYPFLIYIRKNHLSFILTIFCSFIIFRANSRGILILFLLLNFTVFLFSFFPELKKRLPKNVKLKIIFALLTIIIATLFSDSSFLRKRVIDSLKLGRQINISFEDKIPENEEIISGKIDNSISKRVIFTRKALQLFTKNPVLGIGTGSLSTHKIRHAYGTSTMSSLHNYWVEVLAELGFFFFLTYVGWIFMIIKGCLKNEKVLYFYKYPTIGALLLFIPGVIVLSSGVYFLPKWVLFGLACSFSTQSSSMAQDVH